MPDDIQVGGDWFHPLYRSKFKRVATAHADSYRRKGHMARIRRVKDFDNYHKLGKKSFWYVVFVSEKKARR